MTGDVLARLRRAVEERRAAPIEAALADWVLRHGGSAPVAIALAGCSRAVAEGHSCLALDHQLPAIPGESPVCSRGELERALEASDLVGVPGGEARPLILDDGRLYLHRYWAYESALAARLTELLASGPDELDPAPLQPGGGLFDYGWVTGDETHWQAVAAFVALRHRFAVISGGPGTGKTYTVLRLMRLLIELALEAGAPAPVIRLAAPTGKAAARMVESIRTGLAGMNLPPTLREPIPQEAETLHRLIGIGFGTTRPRHDRRNPLAADVVIVDEASMVDLPMMAKLVDALPDHARLVLLGDRYQLASVEAGSVLAELCDAGGINEFSGAQQSVAGELLRAPMKAGTRPLADHVVTLQTSHRFKADSAIGRLAAAVNAGETEEVLTIARTGAPDITLETDVSGERLSGLVDGTAARYRELMHAEEPMTALKQMQGQCLLCAVRRGPLGSSTLNRLITERLAVEHGFDPRRAWYHGRPVIVTRNDYRAGLYNGDIGVCLRGEGERFRVWFQTEEGIRSFLPSALPEHESVYAMTVHKSQGSEFAHVTLVLPDSDSPVLTRELIYTGITRARKTVSVVATEEALRAAVGRRIRRQSGLRARLPGPG